MGQMGWLYCHNFSTTLAAFDGVSPTTGVMMKRYLSPPTTFLAMWAFAALLISSTASAQVVPSETDIGQIVGSFDDFLAETTGTLVCEDIPALLDTSGNPILLTPLEGAPLQASQPIASGQLSFEDDIRFLQFPEDGLSSPHSPFPVRLEIHNP